jgi:hypothetical protein
MKQFLKSLGNGLILTMILSLFVLGIVTIAVQFPTVQTYLVKKVSAYFSEKLEHPISVGRVNIKWFDVISLQYVSVKDVHSEHMIEVERLDVDFDLLGLTGQKKEGIYLDEVTLFKPDVYLQKSDQGNLLNIDVFIAAIAALSEKKDTTNKKNGRFSIGKAAIVDGIFHFRDKKIPSVTDRQIFDFKNFVLDDLQSELLDFSLFGDTVRFRAVDLTAKDRHTGLKIDRLNTRFMFHRKGMELAELDVRAGSSHIKNYLAFHYSHPSDFNDINNRVDIEAHFDDSRIYSQDVGYFAKYLFSLKETWHINGDFNGHVSDFTLSKLNLRFGERSVINGELSFKGLPEFKSTAMLFKLEGTHIYPKDLIQYHPPAKFHQTLQKFGNIRTSALFGGSVADFTIKGNFDTDIGKLETDLVFRALETHNTTYKGFLKTQALDLGLVLDKPESFQKLDFSGTIDGVGLSVQTANSKVSAKVNRIGFNGYDYRNITFDGDLQKSFFKGMVGSIDPNMVFELNGLIDFTQERNHYNFEGIFEQANLGTLGFTKKPLRLHTKVKIEADGNTIDDLTGKASLQDIYLLKPDNDRNLLLDSLTLTVNNDNNVYALQVRSEIVEANLSGDFVPSQAIDDIARLLKEYRLFFAGNESDRDQYYANKVIPDSISRYRIDYSVSTGDMRSLMDFVSPDIYISKGTCLTGFVQMDNTSLVMIEGKSDTLKWGSNHMIGSEIDVFFSKFVRSPEVLATANVTSERQSIQSIIQLEKLFVDATWENDRINFLSNVRQFQASNRAVLNGELDFVESGIKVNLKEGSQFWLLDETWKVNPKNQLLFEGPLVTFKDLSIANGRSRLSLEGTTGSKSGQNLAVEIRDFKLNSVNTLLNSKFDGIMDGLLNIRDLDVGQELDAQFKIEGLQYASRELGNFIGKGEWDKLSKRLQIAAYLEKNMQRTLNVSGFYSPAKEENALDIRADFKRMELKLIEPFASFIVSEINGLASGVVTATGSPTRPKLEGALSVEKGGAKFDYLQAYFTFEDKIYFAENEIVVKKMKLKDPEGNEATLSGGVYHDGFKFPTISFNADFRSFKILNTTAEDNELFHGTAYVTGNAEIFGPAGDLTINSNATSNRGTRIFIPFDGATEVTQSEYIVFASQIRRELDSTGVAFRRARQAAKNGIKMNFNFNITPDAYCEIQLDRQTGDIIKAYGSSLLNLKIDTKGDFALTGTYEIDRGDYTFTLQNAIHKRFDIKPNSRITWTGNPTEATVNIRAGYTQLTSLADILPPSSSTNNSARTRRYPVELIITLTERLMSPKIGYALTFKEYPNIPDFRNGIAIFENQLLNDEQELSKQVSSLLLFNTLLSPNNPLFGTQSQSFVGNSVSELISNQISKWASALDQNLEVGLTGLTLDEHMIDNLQLRFSYRFLNDRFRITRDGRLTNVQNQYDAASLLGEWTLEYWFTPNGTLRGRAYNRNIQNPLLLNNTQTTAGFSLQFSHSFNRFLVPTPVKRDSTSTDTTATATTPLGRSLPRLKWVPLSMRSN